MIFAKRTCGTSADCRVPVYASVGAGQSCIVAVPFDEVVVTRGQRPKVIWQIDALDPGDGFDYQFDPVNGVVIVGNTAQDYTDGQPQGPEKFRWTSVNGRVSELKYSVSLQRRARAGGGSGAGPWLPCPVLDPKIINDGP